MKLSRTEDLPDQPSDFRTIAVAERAIGSSEDCWLKTLEGFDMGEGFVQQPEEHSELTQVGLVQILHWRSFRRSLRPGDDCPLRIPDRTGNPASCLGLAKSNIHRETGTRHPRVLHPPT